MIMADSDLREPEYTEEDASPIRKVIAKRLLESKLTAPHFYITVDADMKNCIALRTELNAGGDQKISYNDIIIKAVAMGLKEHPKCNVSWVDGKIRYYKDIHISLAVAVEGGLLTPTVRDCDEKSIFEINEDTTALIEKTRSRKLRPSEWMGGTFTISNLGMFGIEEFIAIINPPQALILAVGAIREVPVVEDGEIKAGKRMKLTLSGDHRALDGAIAAEFLSGLKTMLEDPKSRLL
jgi:pyruvate dehydrogenase E2 component (dihydrolipoamide acetyltransferase)